METIYTDCSGQSNKKVKKTKFTHYLSTFERKGWVKTQQSPEYYNEVKYLGNCNIDGDMFAVLTRNSEIIIFKGIKGDEFNK